MTPLSPHPEDQPLAAEEWWKTCPTEQLKEIVAVGAAAGERFDLAAREIERRAREKTTTAEVHDEDDKLRQARLMLILRIATYALLAALLLLAARMAWGWR